MRRIVAAYFGQVSFCDHLIGRLTTTLLETKQLDNTLIIFTADHGEMLGRHGLMFKGAAMLEDLVRIPLLAVPPGGLDTARVSASLVSHIDLMPTVLDWCGAEIPPGLEGISIRPQVEQIAAPNRTAVVCEYHSANWTDAITPLRMWRTHDWKYVESYHGDHELYHLATDRHECKNLIDAPSTSHVLAALRDDLHRWCNRNADPWPEVPIPPERPQ
jgi:arylsulfatase A-like enzyme